MNRVWTLFLITACLITNACGKIGTSHPAYVQGENREYLTTPQEKQTSPNLGYECPRQSNVKPGFDENLDGSGYFSVCTHQKNETDILIHGTTHDTDQICVYPAVYLSADQILVETNNNPGPDGRGILSDCKSIAASKDSNDDPDGLKMSFGTRFNGTMYNSVFIVEAIYRDQMDLCLAAGDYYYCPLFAFGRIR